MSIVTAQSSSAFVDGVKLRAPPGGGRKRAKRDGVEEVSAPEPLVQLKNTDAQALVVGCGLIVAAEDVPAQTRADIVNCTLFAQLAAGGSVSDPTDVVAWYRVYFQALTAVGWAQSDQRFEDFEASGTQIEAHKSIIGVLTALLGPGAAAIAVVQKALDALSSMSENSPWITLFDRESTKVKSARFQVATAQVGKGGLIEIALVAFDLESKSTLTQVLFFKFKKNATTLKYARGNATIYEDVLGKNRAKIEERLTAYRSAYIGEIKFPPPPAASVAPAAPARVRAIPKARGNALPKTRGKAKRAA